MSERVSEKERGETERQGENDRQSDGACVSHRATAWSWCRTKAMSILHVMIPYDVYMCACA